MEGLEVPSGSGGVVRHPPAHFMVRELDKLVRRHPRAHDYPGIPFLHDVPFLRHREPSAG